MLLVRGLSYYLTMSHICILWRKLPPCVIRGAARENLCFMTNESQSGRFLMFLLNNILCESFRWVFNQVLLDFQIRASERNKCIVKGKGIKYEFLSECLVHCFLLDCVTSWFRCVLITSLSHLGRVSGSYTPFRAGSGLNVTSDHIYPYIKVVNVTRTVWTSLRLLVYCAPWDLISG